MTTSQAHEQVDPLVDAVDALRVLLLAAHSFRQELAAALGLTVSDTYALSHLAAAGNPSAGELAHRAGLAPSSVTALLDRLERASLVQRAVRPGDRRAQQISLTEHGRQVLALSSRWAKAGFLTLPAAELPLIAGQLRAVATALRQAAEATGGALDAPSLGD
jgi:DNA-binding MarR family transcriptional regulator